MTTRTALLATLVEANDLVQPTMSWTAGPRTQPRSPAGRFLPKAWLASAESYSATDLAWFRSPIRSSSEVR